MRAAIYVRQSLDRSSEGLAVARQRDDCLQLVERRGWQLVHIYEDNDISASSGKRRPGYQALLADLRAGQIDVVVAWASDRLHRRLVELVEFVTAVNDARALVATVNSGDIDLTTPHGRMLAGILGSVAQAEVEQKGLRQQRANQQRAEAGVPRFTRRPYGFTADGRNLVADEAAVIRQSAEAVLAGSSLRDQVRQLHKVGAATSLGQEWSVTSLRRVLMNPRHAGLNRYKGEVLGAGDWPSILSEDTHQALVSYLSDKTRRTASTNVRKYLLSGLVRCGICGDPMYASPTARSSRTWMIYRCRTPHNTRRLDLVDAVVEAVVLARLSRPDALELLSSNKTEPTSELSLTAASLRSRLDEAAGLFADGTVTAAQLRAISSKLREKLGDIERQQAAGGRGNVLVGLLSVSELETTWHDLSLSRKRSVIDALLVATVLPAGKGIRFKPEQVHIEWR